MNTVPRKKQGVFARKKLEKLVAGNLNLIRWVTTIGKRALAALRRNIVFLGSSALVFIIPLLVRLVMLQHTDSAFANHTGSQEDLLLAQKKLDREIKMLDNRLTSKIPKSCYLVINSSSNEFSLFKGPRLIKKDKCSTGSYILLKNGDQQKWMFKTPKGEFPIRSKTTSPVWKKPDWAFVEEGLPVPTVNHPSRYEYGVLGDYALNLGQGYLIHGTLYQRYLGLPVTHGCIRLNDENLELVYKSLTVGSKVYIY